MLWSVWIHNISLFWLSKTEKKRRRRPPAAWRSQLNALIPKGLDVWLSLVDIIFSQLAGTREKRTESKNVLPSGCCPSQPCHLEFAHRFESPVLYSHILYMGFPRSITCCSQSVRHQMDFPSAIPPYHQFHHVSWGERAFRYSAPETVPSFSELLLLCLIVEISEVWNKL